MEHKSEFDHVIDELEECIDGGGDVPTRLDRKRVREVLEDFVSLYNSGKVAG